MKKFILHPESVVSNFALRFFAESFLYENDTTLMPLVIDKLKQTKNTGTIHLPYAYNFPQTEETIRELLDLRKSPSNSKNTNMLIQNILYHCEPQLLIPFKETIEQDPVWKKRVEQKNNLAKMNDQELLDVFRVFIEQSTGKYWGEFDAEYGDDIVNELARRSCMDSETVLQKLRNSDPGDSSYEVPYLIQLAGLMKLEAAIPVLCGFLAEEDDLLQSNAEEALVRIGTPEVIVTLKEQYPASEDEFHRQFAASVLGKIKLPASEEAVLALLPEDRYLTSATTLADSLCELGASKALSVVETMMEEGYARELLNLTDSIYAYCVISGRSHPLLSDWKKELAVQERRMVKHEAELNRMFSTKTPIGTHNRLNGTEKTYVSPEKVGRNDPCPCGSGKKHKKCCGA
ncbi:SEC-C metal-binding domain-containing protein [Paenibacillus sp. MMS20-IR301]|uniref:HEAT repeat domain-containing protein n=1 Tax=Paenibacillus sp. MMS20-IR301 TaxID=2895946 RepID=UPI0028EDCD38|nr:SEC-C metal-binding domain-containing protein [Paenibacillus sp. MMS20-IR301]WNS43501.1 SEC-C metal-binding domain-containing protein [Paenibacillus sp. MMS20-IR301]